MNTRINLLEVLAYLKKSDLIAAVEILVLDETYRRSVCKLRCRLLPSKYQLSVRFIQTKTELIYSYQLLSSAPLARWDNEPHFPKLASFPHHCPGGDSQDYQRIRIHRINIEGSIHNRSVTARRAGAPPRAAALGGPGAGRRLPRPAPFRASRPRAGARHYWALSSELTWPYGSNLYGLRFDTLSANRIRAEWNIVVSKPPGVSQIPGGSPSS